MPIDLNWDLDPALDPLGVLASNRDVAIAADPVRIEPDGVAAVARRLGSGDLATAWDATYHYAGDPASTAQYVFVLDTLNFCFWGEPRWQVELGDGWVNGYYALALALKRAVERGEPILEADWLAKVAATDLARVLGGRNELPMLAERAANLNEAGEWLRRYYNGRFLAAIEDASGSAPILARLLADSLRSYRDVVTVGGVEHRFYKRAQICASDVASALDASEHAPTAGLDLLTAFADYKVPQVLRALGVIEYEPRLAELVDSRSPIPAGSSDEVAIRAATVWAVEHLRRATSAHGEALTAREIDWLLWTLGQDAALMRPYHLTRTIFY